MDSIRLVIWDLDETFWRGTYTEGGFQLIDSHNELVIKLARRGILSTIVSKNNFEEIRRVLEDANLWHYFVFPSISWDPKGPRVANLIETIGLRPATVLFIDDNPLNLAEAQHYTPDLQTSDPSIIDQMDSDPRFRGKDDIELSRLAQYKLLEHRKAQESLVIDTDGSNLGFLRKSGIRVAIEVDLEKHIDRIIELINRTNQLNYTKQRLPEDFASARATLGSLLASRNVQAGCVHVQDRYGDYGIVGFYLLSVHTWRLEHFCFSCRTLGMGLEKWLYNKLKRPALDVVGEVVTDVFDLKDVVDWIEPTSIGEKIISPKSLGCVLLRGGCEMQALAHYIALDAAEIVGEFPFNRNGRSIPIHHSSFISQSLSGLSPAQMESLPSMGYAVSDFSSMLMDRNKRFDAVILSLWADAHYSCYRNRDSGLIVPFAINVINNGQDVRVLDEKQLAAAIQDAALRRAFETLRVDYDCIGWSLGSDSGALVDSRFCHGLQAILERIPSTVKVFILLGCADIMDPDGRISKLGHLDTLNEATRLVSAPFGNVILLNPSDSVISCDEIIDATHFERMVYYRLYQKISTHLSE